MTRATREIGMFLLASAIAAESAAQSSLQIPLQFDFLNPGAKSMALGGAFAGVADDATATFANPAGLTQLGSSEFSVEARQSRVRTPFLQKGRLSGTIADALNDTIQGPFFGESTGSHFGLGYLSGVFVPQSHAYVLAGYRHEPARVDQRFVSEGVFQLAPGEFTSRRELPQEGTRTVSITAYGASAAFKATRRISIGAGLGVYRFSIDSTFRRFDTIGFMGPPDFATELGKSTQVGKDTALAPNVGVLMDRSGVRVGVVYRHGPTFNFTTVSGTTAFPPSQFRVPHAFATGGSYRWSIRRGPPEAERLHSFLVAGEVTRINYSRLTSDFVTDQAQNSGRPGSFGIEDGTEIHLGMQYQATSARLRPHLRVGWWRDPDHSVRYTAPGTSVTAVDLLFDERQSVALSQTGAQSHMTLGGGFVLMPRLETNIGIDLASATKRFSVSIIVK